MLNEFQANLLQTLAYPAQLRSQAANWVLAIGDEK